MKTEIKVYYDTEPIIYTGKEIIENYVRGSQITNDNSNINFEVNSQYGNCKLYDKNSVVYKKITSGTLDSETLIPVELYLDNTLIGKYDAEMDYDIISKQISVELHDSLYSWGNIQYSGFSLYEIYKDPTMGLTFGGEITAYKLYERLRNDTIPLINSSFATPNAFVSGILNQINLKVPHLECSTLLEAWNYFCELILGAVYTNSNGEIDVIIYG